ncbi:MAG: 4-alpha-glucanotransferase [Clostridia bacterium]|nr:4-alpha-glucanotransferase [Clostridia bacterium]
MMQYHFHQQWERLHRYAALKGISVIGDLPFYVSQNSYDVYSAPDKFQLDEAYEPAFVAGVPPDYFSEEGQRWGNPLYRWETMKEDGFLWWKKRLSYMLSLFDGLRIDHFRAIAAYWSIPAREKSAKAGEWKKGPGRDLIDAIREVAGEQLILAEDLGIIDEATKELLRYSGFPGMGVFQFGFDGNPNSVHLPHNYRENQVVYSGTHDNNTLLGFLWEADDELRDSILDYLGYPADGCEGVLRALMMSRAGIVIFPFQDLMKFGADTRINTPGRAAGNWQYRITREQMEKLDRQKYLHLNRIYSRTP